MNFSRKENQSRKVDANSSNEWALIISFVFLAALLGIVATIFPIGFSVKLIMVLLLVVAIPFALMAQSKANAHYKQGFFLLLAWITLHACSPVYLSAKFGSLPDLSPYRLVGWLIMLKVIYWWVASNEFRQIVRLRVRYAQPIFWILLTIILWQIVCSFVGNTPLSSLVFVAKTWFFVPFLFILAISAIRNISDVEKLLILAVLGAVFATLIGVAEWANKDNLFRAFFPVDSERFSAYAWILYDNTRDGVYRVASVFTHPLVFGEYLAVTLPFCLYFIVDSKRRWMRVCALIALSITPIGIYMSHTRSSMIAAIIGLLGFFLARSIVYTRSTIYRMLAITMVLMVACTTIILSSSDISELVKGRTAAERGSSYARKLMFDRALVLVEKSPILGYGPSTGASKIGYLGNSNSLTIDNYYLSMVIESGIPGLLLYIAMLLVPLLRIFQFVDRERAGLLAALVSSVMVFATIRSILSLTHNQDFALLIIAMLMILGCLPKKQQAKRSDSMDDKTNSIETGFISTLSEL